jgi:catechol-2,3-dioxygenase
VGLTVTDLDRSTSFYEQVFGLRTLMASREGHRFAFLGFDDTPILTLWEQAGGAYEAAAAGLHHLSFRVDSAERVREVEGPARRLGAELIHDGAIKHAEGATSGGSTSATPTDCASRCSPRAGSRTR